MKNKLHLLFSCEHGGNDIPARYQGLFRDSGILISHRGWDPGALQLARQLASAFRAPLHFSTVSRLLVDLNRSAHHRQLFSEFTRSLSAADKKEILEKYYLPYRMAIEADIRRLQGKLAAVAHISVHSFTPQLNGDIRNADIGLLYDPARHNEKTFCQTWQNSIRQLAPGLRVRRNYPYTGVQDGLVTALRKQFAGNGYIGVELETSQTFVQQGGQRWQSYRATVQSSLQRVVENYSG